MGNGSRLKPLLQPLLQAARAATILCYVFWLTVTLQLFTVRPVFLATSMSVSDSKRSLESGALLDNENAWETVTYSDPRKAPISYATPAYA